MVDVFKATLHKDPRLRLPLDKLNQLLRDRRLWAMEQTPTSDGLAAEVSATVHNVLRRDAVDDDFGAGAWYNAADFVPWWETRESLLKGLHRRSKKLRRQT